jgi:hypothetical protein
MTIKDMERIRQGESFLCVVKNHKGEQGAITAYFNFDHCGFFETYLMDNA